MKILQILTELGSGGAERVALELCKGLSRLGHMPVVASLKPPPANGSIPALLEEAGVKVRYAGIEKCRPWRIKELARIVAEESPDLIHSHLMHPNILSRLLKIRNGLPLVNTVHIAERRPRMMGWFMLDSSTFKLCDVCTAVSKAAANFHEDALGIPRGSIKVIYNGVDPVVPASPETLAALKNEWALNGCSKILGSVGRLDWQKGYDILLEMLPALSKRVPSGEKWGVLIIGAGAERRKLEELGVKCPENMKLCLPGFRSDAASLMPLFDAFVMPSRYEGYGLTLAEAMSLGLPCVASSVDSLPELCEGVPKCLCVDFLSRQEEAIDAIVNALNSPRQAPHPIMSVEKMLEAYLEVYSSLLSRPK